MSSGSLESVVGIGASLGVVHVLTGPDHMAAIATLACGGKLRSFYLGARWGVGHSVGIIVVYTIFLLIPDFELESMGQTGDTVVGVLMICLGIFGLWRARMRYLATLRPSNGPDQHQNLLDGVPMFDPLLFSQDPEHQPKHEAEDTHSASTGRCAPEDTARTDEIGNVHSDQITLCVEPGDPTTQGTPDYPLAGENAESEGRAADQTIDRDDRALDYDNGANTADADQAEHKNPPRWASLMRFADMLLGTAPVPPQSLLLPVPTTASPP